MSPADAPADAAARPARPAVFSPLYRQIKDLLLKSLDEGEWKPGELIPSEIDLATRFQVSQGTVRKAVDELASENLLVRRQGKGTFVATHHEPRAQFRFLRVIPDEGDPAAPQSRFLDCRRLRAPAEIARQLDLRTGDAVVYLRRLLSFGGDPIVLDEIWLPGTLFKGLTAERLAEYKGPLYGLFETEFGTRMIRAEEQLRAVGAERQAAQLLGVPEGAPLLLVERVSYSYGDRPVEVRRGLYVTEHYHYRNTLF
ncbi:MAG TPA: GntR family transcriptional regulator [Burkholderiaceae bacterium]|nr:GntR family transcriptional regulator [Burkholderiaceae bacterium]HQR71258.1 GntR family transcriptional regulator [Burkholderiaceae bacterium]